jgi:hypothetical protein
VLARALWFALGGLLLLATPTLSVETVLEALQEPVPFLGDAGPRADAEVRAEQPAPAGLGGLGVRGLGLDAMATPRVRTTVSIEVLGGGAPARAANGTQAVAGHTTMASARPSGTADHWRVAALVADQLREERAGGPRMGPTSVDAALGDWRAQERGERLAVGRGTFSVTDAEGQRVECGVTGVAAFLVWGEHLRLAVRSADPNPACAPMGSIVPKGLLQPTEEGWSSRIEGAGNVQELLLGGAAESSVPLAYRVQLADGRAFAFEGRLDLLAERVA